MDSQRRQWTEGRRRKEPSEYDEWLKEERIIQQQQQQQQQSHQSQQQQPPLPPRRGSAQVVSTSVMPLRQGSTAGGSVTSVETSGAQQHTAGTIRTVASDDTNSMHSAANGEDDGPFTTERGTTSFENAFIPPNTTGGVALGTTTTITGGKAASSVRSPGTSAASKTRRLLRERDWSRDLRVSEHISSPPGNKSGNGASTGMLGRRNSRAGQSSQTPSASTARGHAAAAPNTSRPRTRTVGEQRRREEADVSLMKSRNRMGSVHTPSSPIYQGAEYLASVPALTSPPSAPSITSLGSPVQPPVEVTVQRSTSPMSSETTGSIPTVLPPANARRIVHLMKTMNGRMSGNVVFRRGVNQPWGQSFCYVQEDTGSLMYEPRGGEDVHKTLIRDLRGWRVIPNVEDETPYLEVTLPGYEDEIHFKVQTQADFDAWFATFMWWQTQSHELNRPSSAASNRTTPEPSHPSGTSSSAREGDRASSIKSDRRRSTAPNHQKEAPVIKIGKMIFWDTNVGFSSTGEASLGPPNTARPQAYRTQSYGSRRFRRISGQLRENGELKLHFDADNSLISVVQLSQLSRCAIQRLDATVMDNDYCIAIYPQYTAGSTSNHQPGFVRPIFLSLESRVLYEVWFVLLRAFTMPQLYGPPRHEDEEETDGQHASMHSSTDEMFRVERSMSIRIVEAKMYPPTSVPSTNEAGFSGGHNQGAQNAVKPEQHGYYAEVLLDDETRGKTAVKHEGLTPLWGESFEFQDLPPVLGSASVVIKRRPPDNVYVRQQNESKLAHEKYGFTNDQNGGYTGLTFDVTCGKVEIYLQELEEQKEVEKWWGVFNMYETRVGDVLIKARAEEGVILMAKDYQPLSDLLHQFSNGLTLQIAQMLPGELKRLSDCLLNIYQVSGKAGDWIQAMVEEEIDGIHRETPISRLRYSRRVGSEGGAEVHSYGHKEPTNSDRELIVRDMNKNATLEANLLFRGNTLLTKSLDTHMRRVGREYLEQCLSAQIHEINDKDMDCEVDPNRVSSQTDLDRNWRRLLGFTQDVWKAILAAKSQCPVELRMIFRHIRACAEDRYGDFLRTVQYSSVSGFLFLRFFCPAVLNPKLFGLLKYDIRPRSRRTFTLIAKSLQTLANMASFGTKEQWMEPMNFFLTQNRESFKNFIDDICYVPAPVSNSSSFGPSGPSPNYSTGLVSAETHLSYTTPMTIMQRLPATSREGFPSLPYLIDQARAFAELVQLWIDTTSPPPAPDGNSAPSRRYSDIINAINASDGNMIAFHETCVNLSRRTQECLNRAERAERSNSELSFRIEGLLDQLPSARTTEESSDDLADHTYDPIADRIASDPSILPPGMDSSSRVGNLLPPRHREWDHITDEVDEDAHQTRFYDPTPQPSISESFDHAASSGMQSRQHLPLRGRPGSVSLGNTIQGSLRRALQSRGSEHSPVQSTPSASASNVSSNVSSDTEHTVGTTALPNYEREVRHRERREAAKAQIQQQVEEAKLRKEEKKGNLRIKTPLQALRKRKEKEGKEGKGDREERSGTRRGVDMSHV